MTQSHFQIRYKKDKAFRAKHIANTKKSYYKHLDRNRLKARIATRKFRLSHPDYYKAYQAAYFIKHRERIIKRMKRRYQRIAKVKRLASALARMNLARRILGYKER